jgi:ABC-type uncharacterized transport system ATPase subunit
VTAAAALELRSINKSFGSTIALADASLNAALGSIHVLLGENGAGKTTLLRAAAGFITPDAGEILFDGSPVYWKSRADALRAGIAIVEQHFSLVPAMTVAENVALAANPWNSRFNSAEAARAVTKTAESVGLAVEPGAIVASLSVAAQQRAEIVKALSTNARLLILDEPTAVLTPAESDELFRWLRSFVVSGRTAIVITHRVREAMAHGDALTVLRAGRTILSSRSDAISRDEVVRSIIGDQTRPLDPAPPPRESPGSVAVVASLHSVSVAPQSGVPRLLSVSVEIRTGEIVGVAGVEGSGERELLRVLGGRLQPSSGTANLPTATAFIPEDRLRDSLVPEMALTENFAIRGIGARRGTLDWPAMESAATAAMKVFDVRAETPRQAAQTLSGGNQQKFVLARELIDKPALIVAENPTRGLDVRASADVMARLRRARDAGAAVVVYSSDLEELIDISDRVLVCFGGSVREVAPELAAVGNALLGSA